MKKNIIITIITILFVLSACGNSDKKSTIVETIKVQYDSSPGGYNSDVEIYLDGDVLGKLKAGSSGSYNVTLTSGNHKIWAKEKALLHANYKSNKVNFQAESSGNSFHLVSGAITRLKLEDETVYESTDTDDAKNASNDDNTIHNNKVKIKNTENSSYSEPYIKAGAYYPDTDYCEPIEIAIWSKNDNPIGCLVTYDFLTDKGGYHDLVYISDNKYALSDNEDFTLEFSYSESTDSIPIYLGTESNSIAGTLNGYHTVNIYTQGALFGTYIQKSVIINE